MESVLSVKTELLEPYLTKNGLITGSERVITQLVLAHHEFLPRPQAEEDPSYRQVIPYIVICRGGEVFATRRLNKGGESRLHGLISLGVGGHIDRAEDGDGDDVLMRGLIRELREEVDMDDVGTLEFRGIINDASNDVGSVHLGFFYTLDTRGEVRVKETEKLEGMWLSRSQLPELLSSMETWSQIVTQAALI